jgi:hypothetical protein
LHTAINPSKQRELGRGIEIGDCISQSLSVRSAMIVFRTVFGGLAQYRDPHRGSAVFPARLDFTLERN